MYDFLNAIGGMGFAILGDGGSVLRGIRQGHRSRG